MSKPFPEPSRVHRPLSRGMKRPDFVFEHEWTFDETRGEGDDMEEVSVDYLCTVELSDWTNGCADTYWEPGWPSGYEYVQVFKHLPDGTSVELEATSKEVDGLVEMAHVAAHEDDR